MFAKETKEVTLYSYDAKGVFGGEFQYLWVTGTGLASNSTLEKPLKDKDGFVSIWNGSAWEYQENHLNKTIYSTKTKEPKTVDYIGEIEQGWTLLGPIQFGVWNGSAWVDNRTAEEIKEHERSLLSPLTKRQLSLHLFDIGKYDEVMNALNSNPRFKIEFETASVIERNSPTVSTIGQILEWDDLVIDEIWEAALLL